MRFTTILFLILISLPHLHAQPLNGEYTIGGNAPDFLHFSDAVNSLKTNGIDGHVTFNIRPGTYEPLNQGERVIFIDDMIIGEALWERFTNMLEADDFGNKHHIYAEMCSKPTNEFIYDMREVMANTKRGKAIIQEISEKVREDIKRDEYMSEYDDDPYNDLTDLLGDINPEDIIN